MRQQSRILIKVRGLTIGGPKPYICLPIMAKTISDLAIETDSAVALSADMLEWRADAYSHPLSLGDLRAALDELRLHAGEIPIIFTLRSAQEGGIQEFARTERLQLIEAAIASKQIDFVDIELSNDLDFIIEVKRYTNAADCRLILSSHDFKKTPSKSAIMARLLEAQKKGADIAKIAVMPNSYHDVLNLLAATDRARNGALAIPMITMAMGIEGKISRLAGGLFGSDITFAEGRTASAPGQIPIDEMKPVLDLLYQ